MRRWFCFLANDNRPARGNKSALAGLRAFGAILILISGASVGCDSNSFVPPRPEELGGTGTTVSVPLKNAPAPPEGLEVASARAVEIVLAPRDAEDGEIWKNAARTQSGHEKIKVKVVVTGADEHKSKKQIDLVREAMARNPRVLVVEPADHSDIAVAEAIGETLAQGIPVVVLGRPLAGDKPAAPINSASATAPLVVVAPPLFAASARELVTAVIRNASAAGLDPKAGAIIAIDTKGDTFLPERVAGIREALAKAGITSVEEIRVTHDQKEGEKLVTESLKAHPNFTLIFSVDFWSTVAIRNFMNPKPDTPILVAGSYTSDANVQDVLNQVPVAAVVDYNPVRLLRKAIITAASLAQGKFVSSPAELSVGVEDLASHLAGLKAAVINAKKAKEAK